MVEQFSEWLRSTSVAWFVLNYPWVWSASETLHFVGLCLLFGVILVIDLRMLGMMKNVRFAALHRFLPWAIFGFAINVVSGLLFFVATPEQYTYNVSFHLKMICMFLAGINVLVFYVTVFHDVEALQPGEDAPLSAKIVAGFSIFLWTGVIFFGRMLPYIGDSF